MARTFAAVVWAVLLVATAPAAHAQTAFPPSLELDSRFALPDGIGREFDDDFDSASAVAVAGDRIYSVGSVNEGSASDVGVVARHSGGTYDRGFSGDGKLILPIAPGTGADTALDVVVLPSGKLRILASTDVDATPTTQIDVAIVGLNADGTTDTGFGPGGSGVVTFPASAGVDTPTRMALAPDGRLAITGYATVSSNEDAFVALRLADGSPAPGFGASGLRTLSLAGTLRDRGVDVEFRPGGGLLMLAQVETNPSASATDYEAVVRAFTEEDAADDPRFMGTGALTLGPGEPDTSPGGLLVHAGRIWVSGATRSGGETQGFVARMNPDGTAAEYRTYATRGGIIDPDAPVISSGSDLDVVPGTPPTLVVGGSVIYNQHPYWAAAAFNGIDGPLSAAGFGDVVIPIEEYGAITDVAASPAGWAAVAGSLFDLGAADRSFGTARVLVDADKACDLALEVVEPLELSVPPTLVAPVTLRVANGGTRSCTGTLSVPPAYQLEGGDTVFTLAPGASATTAGLRLRYSGPRRREDQIDFRVSAPGDSNPQNDSRSLRVLFSYCDVALERGGRTPRAPTEGPRRYELSVRNVGTATCAGVRVAVAGGGSLAGKGERFSLRAGRSASADARAVVAAGGRVGRRAALTFRAVATRDVAAGNDRLTLRPKLVGVGDSDVRRAGANGFRGTARGGSGAKDARLLAVRAVEVAVQRAGPGCRSLAGRSGRLRKAGSGRACAKVWVKAVGTRRWRLPLRTPLPSGRYVLYTRAVIGSGFREGRFSAQDRNKVAFGVS